MGFINRLEQGLEKAVRGTFSKGGGFEPVDIANRLRTDMDKQAYSVSSGHTIAPNVFTVNFAHQDFSRAQQWGVPLAEELCDVVIRHARAQGYSLRGAVRVTFAVDSTLEPGLFEVETSQQKVASPSTAKAKTSQPEQPRTVSTYQPPSASQQDLPQRITRPAASDRTQLLTPQPPRKAPAQPQRIVLLDINGKQLVVRKLPVTLGRGSQADITVEDSGVSRRHLEIVEQDGVYLAVDLGSTNGSYLDGQRLRGRARLQQGSVLEMGRTRIVFRLMGTKD